MLCGVLVVTLVGSGGSAAAAGDVFEDVTGTPYAAAVEALAARKIVAGCGSGRFCPTAPLRRDQAASLLARAFDLPAATRDHFSDDDHNVHEDAINRLAEAGVATGCTADRFCPGRRLTRGQTASLLARARGLDATEHVYFRDVGPPHRGAVNRLAAAGITRGCATAPRRYCAGAHTLRGEMALFLARALDLRPRTDLRPLSRGGEDVFDARSKREAQQRRRAKHEQARRKARKKEQAREEQQARKRRQRRKRDKERNAVWDRLAACESGGNWSINSGNGYYGGLQFSLGSWRAVGGSGYPHQASRAEQIRRGKRLQARQGWGAWPACSRKLGLR